MSRTNARCSLDFRGSARGRGLGVFCVAATVLSACSSDPDIAQPPSFNRPSGVAFACYRRELQQFAALSECEGNDASTTLTALVAQSSTGEVAAVDVQSETRAREVLDVDVRIPGFTFVTVGELPLDVAVPSTTSDRTYVANFGSQNIEAWPTLAFRPETNQMAMGPEEVPLSAGPTALAIAPSEGFLYAALPGQGSVVEIAIGSGTPTVSQTFALSTALPAPVDLTDTISYPQVPDPTAYQKLCNVEVPLESPPSRVAPRAPETLGATPAPTDLVVDREAQRMYISDGHLPVIHVLELSTAGATQGTPIYAGVPTSELALTPAVSEAFHQTPPDAPQAARYLYAIDRTDGSVLVIDAEPTSSTYGAVLPVSDDNTAIDRIDFGVSARALEVLTPQYEGIPSTADLAGLCALGGVQAATAEPTNLRGVFLAVGLLDGTVRFVDVFDLDAPCRGGEPAAGGVCTEPPNERDVQVLIRRNRPRVRSFLNQPLVQITQGPTIVLDGNALRVQNDGSTTLSEAPDLGTLPSCPAGMTRVFAAEGEGQRLLCAYADPWVSSAQLWTATYNGRLPGTVGGRGRLQGNALGAQDASFCSRGVLAGDQLVITGRVPPDRQGTEACARFAESEVDDELAPRFAIAQAEPQQLVLGASLVPGVTLEDVRACFSELLSYEVRLRQQYLVAGSQAGFEHRVRVGGSGQCEADPSVPSPGRAIPGQIFQNAWVSFLIGPVPAPGGGTQPGPPEGDVQLVFGVGGFPSTLLVNPSNRLPVFPRDLHYGAVDKHLYMVDIATNTLIRMGLDPLRITNVYGSTLN